MNRELFLAVSDRIETEVTALRWIYFDDEASTYRTNAPECLSLPACSTLRTPTRKTKPMWNDRGGSS